ncbi:MAG: hypothetical protein ACK53L_07695, partial [Pirellulaceae bacterium]
DASRHRTQPRSLNGVGPAPASWPVARQVILARLAIASPPAAATVYSRSPKRRGWSAEHDGREPDSPRRNV